MKNTIIFLFAFIFLAKNSNAQNITELGPDNYRSIQVEWDGYSDYTKSVILLHEIWSGTPLSPNFAIGTLTAKRGETTAFNRLSTVQINSSSAYTETFASFNAHSTLGQWKLKTCTYNGKKYLAMETPYYPAGFNQGYYFTGYAKSSALLMKCVSYEINGQPVNQNILSDIQDYTGESLNEKIQSNVLEITGNVGIGTTNPGYKLDVIGTIRSREVKVDLLGADFVFEKDYDLMPLSDLEKYITTNKHLPQIATAKEMESNGVELGNLNSKLLQKVEELTLYLIEQKKATDELKEIIKDQNQKILKLENNIKK